MAVLFKMFALLIFVFIVSSPTFGTADDENITSSLYDQEANCVLPPYPEHGKYTVKNYPSAMPGEHYPSVTLDVSCDSGYENDNNTNSIYCVNGFWSETIPKCASFCRLLNDLSVEYHCELSGPESFNGSGECGSMVPSGTVVTPVCRSPGYYSLGVLAKMHCIDGIWDYTPTCKSVSSPTLSTADDENITSSPYNQEANCVLPSQPEHGKYTVKNYPNAMPGENYPSVKLDISCDIGYQNENDTNSIFCVNGYWSETMPKCVSFCTLINDLSVEYRCELSGPESFQGSRECEFLVPSGTIVTPVCRSPGYYSLGVLAKMHCIDGIWDYTPTCKPACGTMPQHLEPEGTSNHHVDLPWNAVIYMKFSSPYVESYMQICGGSLISSHTVISAAHCFWNDEAELLPASNYVVAVGKLYRAYNDPRDKNSQRSNVIDIKVSSYFHGAGSNYQNDIAMVIVETPFIFHLSVRPVCLNFDYHLDRTQLAEGNSGIAAGWSIVARNGQASQVMKVVDIPYIKLKDCYDMSPTYFREYITSDKFCAGSPNGTWFCKGDSGAGLAFLEPTTQRYYLRGVLSVSPTNEDDCSSFNTFTSVTKYEHFIKEHL